MTTKTTPLDLIAIRKHILNELDFVSWVLKTEAVQTIKAHSFDRFNQNKYQNPTNQQPTQILPIQDLAPKPIVKTAKINTKNQLENIKIVIENTQSIHPSIHQTKPINPSHFDKNSQIPTIQSAHTITQTQSLPKALMGIVANIEQFSLSGICYGDWLILVDNQQMSLNEKAVWHSLANKLTHDSKALYLDIHYPLVANDYPEYETFLQGTHSLLGFLLRLCVNHLTHDKLSLKLAILTPLTAGIELGNLATYQQPTPTLNDMIRHADAKKAFWQVLHSTSTP